MNRQLYRQLLRRRGRMRAAAGLWLCLCAWLALVTASPRTGQAAAPRSPGAISATAYDGTLRVRLSVSASATGPAQLTAQAWVNGRPVVGGRVSILLTSLSHPDLTGQSQPMNSHGRLYQSSASLVRAQSWEALLRIRAPAAFSGTRSIPFCLRLAAENQTAPTLAYALFSPLAAGGASVSLPLGPFVAAMQVSPAAAGQNTLRVRLSSSRKGQTFPASLRFDVTMVDMDMGHTYLTATKVRSGVYTADMRLLMGGAWRVDLSTGSAENAAVLVAAAHSPS